MTTSFKVVLLLSVLVLMWTIAALDLTESQSANTTPNTIAVVEQIRPGLSKEQLDALLQRPPDNHAVIPDPTRDICLWWLDTSTFVCVIFENGKAVRWAENTSGYKREHA